MSRLRGLHFEPLWWSLFSAGGVCFAVFVPAVALVFGVLVPLGVIEVSFVELVGWYQGIWGLIFTGAVLCLPAFHAAHRIRHGLHDLKLGGGSTSAFICYGVAAVFSFTALWAWFTF
ncbi:MAG: fumarate reductase subunit D [Idiomarina sp.]|nr:fumarate reductase subunit D [Idiomarina sp.]